MFRSTNCIRLKVTVMEAVRRETAKTGAMGISIDQQGKHKERFSVQEKG